MFSLSRPVQLARQAIPTCPVAKSFLVCLVPFADVSAPTCVLGTAFVHIATDPVYSGDVVFANSTCYGDDLMNKLAQGAAALKEGAIVVTMTDPVPSPAFEVLEEVRTKSLKAMAMAMLASQLFLLPEIPEERNNKQYGRPLA